MAQRVNEIQNNMMVKDVNITSVLKSDSHKAIAQILSSGRAFTQIELSGLANLSQEKTEVILNEFDEDGLMHIILNRRSYYKFKNREVINEVIENMDITNGYVTAKNYSEPLHYCRSCYGHLAGKVGVEVTKALMNNGYLALVNTEGGENFEVTPLGKVFFEKFGIEVNDLEKQSGRFIKACLDFSERQYHLGGKLGVALLDAMKMNGWISRNENSRVHVLTAKGRDELNRALSLELKIVP